MLEHFLAVLVSCALYLCLSVAFFGWGLAISRLLRIPSAKVHSRVILVWLGWAVCLSLFEFLHFFFPINLYIVSPVLLVGIAFGISEISRLAIRFFKNKHHQTQKFLGLVVLLALVGWVASKSMQPPVIYDSGLYHFSAMRWINTFSIVPGLGNLHGRLAFNASFFTYAASLNFFPLFNQGRTIANSFIFLLTLGTMLMYLKPVLKKPSLLWQSHPFKYLPALLNLPILGYLLFKSDGFASPSPDLSIILLQLTLFVLFTRSLEAHIAGERQQLFSLFAIFILTVTSITIKLSNLLFDLLLISYGLIYLWWLYRGNLKTSINLFIVPGFISLVWSGRGLILSGAVFFPSTMFSFPFEWAVPREAEIIEANWIFSWARQPNTHWQEVLGSWDWFGPWLEANLPNLTLFSYPLAISALLFVIILLLGLRNKQSLPSLLEWSLLPPLVFVLAYWFFSAPDLRFANASFFLLLVSALLLFFTAAQRTFKPRLYMLMFFFGILLCNLQYLRIYALNLNTLLDISTSGYQALPEVVLTQVRTDSGLLLYTPTEGDQCWDAPLPCTPYVNPTLTLRKEGDLSSGFFVTDYEDTRFSVP